MSEPSQMEQEASVTRLVSGIISDGQELMKQQFALLRAELKEDVRKAREASMMLAFGFTVLFVGCIVLALMLVYLLSWAIPSLPLWTCFGIVGCLFTLTGAGLCLGGFKRLKSAASLDQSVQEFKETTQWIANPR